ncbi:hypothetical protein M9458_049572, partial [Cirrhinus mrigala]
MATRKKSQRGRKPREGLRRAASARDPEIDFSGESEELEEKFEDASKQTSTPRQKAVTEEGETLTAGMVSLMRDFLDAQQKREERHLLELRGLRDSITTAIQVQPTTPSAEESPRMSLPTPRQTTQHTPRSEPQLPTFQAGEDMENFLNRFERMARTWRWPSEEWSYRLVPLLTGQALEAYLAMDEEEAEDYTELRKALLEKFDISPETYRQRFRATTMPAGESPIETYHRLKTLYRRWVRPEQSTKEEIGEIIVLEQLLRVLPSETRTWVKEHEPTSGLAAAKLAQQYVHAHRVSSHRSQPFKDTEPDPLLSCSVVTRAKARAGLQPLPDFDDSLLQGGSKGPRKTRRQRRIAKYLGSPIPEIDIKDLEEPSWKLPIDIGSMQKNDLAPLQPLPIITEPFKRIAMDIVGPLERSKTGNQYILVVSDYATRYPEAFPLRSITTPKLFSRVGIPDEILTDQGTNFTSQLMRQFQQQLGIKSIRTSPYHPQTDGLVERHVQGPLDMLKRSWEPTTKPSERSIVSYILEMRERLNKYREEATVNLQQAQRAQKLWYDKNCRQREYQPGQKVLLLLPTSANKLLARWQGPYAITRKMGPVTYEVYHPDKGKDKQIYHVNLLKEWKERHCDTAKTALMVRQVSLEEDEDDKLAQEQQLNADIEYLPKQDQTQLLQLLTQFPQLLRQRPGRTTVIQHHIHLTDTTPCRQRPYRVPESLLMPLKQEIQTMLDLGVIEPSESEWSSPLVIVPKKDKSLRVCIDFRKLNSQSRFDAYPMPRIDELLERIGRARFLTTLDLCKGYWQVPLDPASRPYTAFRSPSGLFHFTVLPFGLHGAPATFQRLMDRVLQGCEKWAAAYLDDVIIFSDTFKDHLQHLEETLGRIQRAGLTLNMRKCRWAQKETSYLGYILGNGQIKPQVSKVEAIQRSPRPTTKKEVRSFLGLIGWYRRFIPDFATLATPLTELLTKAVKTPLPWTDECDTAFRNLKNRLCTRSVLQSPDFSQRFLVQVDASATGLGAVLAQGSTGEERPVVFLSRKLLPREQRYSTIEKECLAIKWALESFRYYLLGREFDLETDHRALSWINTMKDHNARVTRWYLSLQPFQFQVRHIPGKMNVVADYLSRVTDGRPPGEGG